MTNYAVLIYVIVIALAIGSFVGMLSYRLPLLLKRSWFQACKDFLADKSIAAEVAQLPEKFSLALPFSHCPTCKAKLRFRDNIPLISYLLRKGKCHDCKVSIPPDYFICELAIACIITALYLALGNQVSFYIYSIIYTAIFAAMMIDARHSILPDVLTIPLLVFVVAISAINDLDLYALPFTIATPMSVLSALIGYLFLAVPNSLYRLIRKTDGIGQGDFKLMAVAGSMLGINGVVMCLLIASLLGTIVALLKGLKSNSAIPFGPFIGIAILSVHYVSLLTS